MLLTDPVDPTPALDLGAFALAATAGPLELEGFAHLTEREPGLWICCAPCSVAMAAHYVTGSPATLEEAHRLRTAAGYPHRGGTMPGRVAAEVAGAPFRPVPVTVADVTRELAAGAAIVVGLTARLLPAKLRRWSPAFAGLHSVTLAGLSSSGAWGYWDPLAPAGKGGEWADPDAAIRAVWPDGLVGARRARGVAILTTGLRLTSDHAVTLPAGTPILAEPAAGSAELGRATGGPFAYFGAAGAWMAVRFDPGNGSRIGYASSAARPYAVVAPAPVGDVTAARLEGAQAEWDAITARLGIPSRPSSIGADGRPE